MNLYLYSDANPVRFTDPDGLQLQGSCLCGLQLEMVRRVGPIDALRARNIGQRASSIAGASGLVAPHPRDSYRHCVLSCMLAQELGQRQALTVTNTYDEECTSNLPADERQDLFNNSVRRLLGWAGINCENVCMSALQSNRLQRYP